MKETGNPWMSISYQVRTLIILMMSVVTSCAHPGLESLKSKHEAPKAAYQSESSDEVTIAVVGINDFHGSLIAKERKLPDGRMVHSGGAASLAGMLKILRQEMKGRVLVVDAGDEWQGTLESNQFKGATVVEFFNRIGVKVAAIGNHEFDFNLDNMVQRFSEAKYKYVASNIFEKSTGKRVNWKNVRPSEIIEVDGIRFGVIGFSTTQTPSTTRYETVKHLEFRDPAHSVIQEATSLRSKKVNAVLVTAHAGSSCENRDELYDWKIHNSSNGQSKCDTDDEILKLATGLTPGLVDGFVSGHTHQVIHHFYGGAPVVQGEAYNQYFNIIYYTFNRKSGKLLSEKTRIEGVVPICDQFFEGTSHCDVRRLKADSSPELVPALFHGIKVEPDSDVTRWLTPIVEGTEKFRREVLTTTELPLSHYRDREGAFGNLIADVLREKGHADFALVNSGGVRTAIDAGPITFDGLFRALPFDNLLNVVQLSGAEIKMLYRVASSGSHGVIAVSGLQLTLIPFDQVAPKSDLNQDGRLEAWETNRLLSIRTSEGKPIEDDQRYSVATFDFLVNGGDDLHWFMGKIPTRFISRQFSGYCRDLVSDYLKTQKVINTQSHPLVDPEHPRIIFKSGSVQ